MAKNDGQGTVGSHSIAFVVFQILDDVPDQYKKIQIKGVIDDQQPKVFKIKGDGKKGKNHQGRGNKVAEPKQPFKAAAAGPYGQDKKSKKQQRLKVHKPGGDQGGGIEQKIEQQLTFQLNEVFQKVLLGSVDVIFFGIIKIVDDKSCCGRKGGSQNQCKEPGIEHYR